MGDTEGPDACMGGGSEWIKLGNIKHRNVNYYSNYIEISKHRPLNAEVEARFDYRLAGIVLHRQGDRKNNEDKCLYSSFFLSSCQCMCCKSRLLNMNYTFLALLLHSLANAK